MRLLYAVTAHGLGHWTRSAALIDALLDVAPDLEVIASTGLDAAVVERAFGDRVRHRRVDYEPGAMQHNFLDVDPQATAEAYLRFEAERESRLARESRFLSTERVDLVLSDASALAVRAATDVGIPGMVVANFTWDWLLEPTLADTHASHVVAQLAHDYSGGTLHWLLPFGQQQTPLSALRHAPIVARQARHTPAYTRQLLGLPERGARPLMLVCIGGWRGQGPSSIRVRGASAVESLIVGDLPIECDGPTHRLPYDLPGALRFPDLVQLADLVITKPGYGMASECAVHGTPVAFVERDCFRESPAIVASLAQRHPTCALARKDFDRGAWGDAIERLLSAPPCARHPNGTRDLAQAILAERWPG